MQIQGVVGFDWDDGNSEKCQKHGVSISEIEAVFHGIVNFFPDLTHSKDEPRYIALGKNEEVRSIFIAFTLRHRKDGTYIRPISSRYTHNKEVEYYEKTITNPK